MLNLARQIIAEGVAYDEEARDAFHEAMQWPEVVEVEERNVMDQSARHAAQLLGSDNVDAMVLRVYEARARQQAAEQAAAGSESSSDQG